MRKATLVKLGLILMMALITACKTEPETVSERDELKAKAQGISGAQMPGQLDMAHQKKMDGLKAASAGKFLKQYKSDQVKGHQEAVALFEGYAAGGDNAELKAWAQQTLPTLQHHLQEAQQLPTSVGSAPTVGSGSSSR